MVRIYLGIGASVAAVSILAPAEVRLPFLAFSISLLAAEYGLFPGLWAGALAGVLWICTAGFGPFPQAFRMPTLMLAVGGAFGALGERHRRKLGELRAQYEEVREGLEDLSVQYLALQEAYRELERRIMGQSATVETLYRVSRRLESLFPEEVYQAAPELVRDFLDAEACALYLKVDGKLVLKGAVGEPKTGSRPQELPLDVWPVGEALEKGRVVSLRDKEEFSAGEALREPILMAAPLLAGGDALGVLVVESLPFLKLTPSSIRMLSIIADWTGRALDTAQRFQSLRREAVEDEVSGVYSFSYIRNRLKEEWERAKRYKVPLSVLLFRVLEYSEIPPENREKVLLSLGAVFRYILRTVDIVGKYRYEEGFVVLLPMTPLPGAYRTAERVLGEVRAFGFKPFPDERELRLGWAAEEFREDLADPLKLLEELWEKAR